MNHNLDNINKYFELPISHNDGKMPVSENIIDDLELSGAKQNNSLYNSLFCNENEYAKETSELWREYYTDDKHFIKDTQKMLKKEYIYDTKPLKCWKTLKGDPEFNDKFQFIDNSYLKFLNNNSIFLEIICLYKFASPLIALIYPLFLLFIPIIILKYNGVKVTYSQYFNMIKMMIMNNSLVQLFTNFSIQNWRQTVYLLFSAFMYIFGIYQNIISCIRFHFNMKNINIYIREMRDYIKNTVAKIDDFGNKNKNLSTYSGFVDKMYVQRDILSNRLQSFDQIDDYSWNVRNLSNMGYTMKMLYHIYHDSDFHNAIMYSFGFNGFILNIQDIQDNIKSKNINSIKFGKNTKFKRAYYPAFKNKKHVKNDYTLKDSLVISGPNASGKTTLIKTTLFNVLLSQQIGYGFYTSGCTKMYKYIHSYLNIPDTSDRDSLFQAEARRCREIISSLDDNKKENHFCIFDELYSGTNPYEANASAYAFIKYMLKHNVDFMLTTHFVELCKNLIDVKNITNVQMDIVVKNDDIEYLYKLKSGISEHKGGVKVLRDLNYPIEVINDTVTYLAK